MSENGDIRIVVSRCKESARVVIEGPDHASVVTRDVLAGLAQQRGVIVDSHVLTKLEAIAERYIETRESVDEEFATSLPAKPGTPAIVEWADAGDPTAIAESDESHSEEGSADFYNAVDYVQVDEGQQIATFFPRELGEEGRDVCGGVIPAPTPPILAFEFDRSSIEIRDDGAVIARRSGILRYRKLLVEIANLLVVENIDFATGNLDTKGSVHVTKDVRDNFEISATEDIIIDGLVESANLRCGRDLFLRRGMSGRNRGRLTVSGDATIGFINDAQVMVEGDLTVSDEITNSDVIVRGALKAAGAAMVGGVVVVTGGIEIETIGSDAEIPTKLIVTASPKAMYERKELISELNTLARELDDSTARLQRIEQNASALTAAQREEMTELTFQISMCETRADELRRQITEIEGAAGGAPFVQLRVGKVIHPRVTIRTEGQEITFNRPVRGPVRIAWNSAKRLVAERRDGSVTDLSDIIRSAAA